MIFPEHEFIGTCINFGFTLSDLEKLTYIDIMKILISQIKEENSRTATQRDIDKLLG